MKNRILTKRNISYLFYLIVIVYGILLVSFNAFGPIDDYNFIRTLLQGKRFWFFDLFYINPLARFVPLFGIEYNLVSLFSTSPTAFYTYSLLQFVILLVLLNKILITSLGKESKGIRYLVLLGLILTPAFSTAWFRLLIPDRNELFFFVLFIYCYLLFQKKPKILYLIFGLLAANIALYYKEPAFLMIGGFTFFHLIFGWKTLSKNQKIFDYLLILSSVIFILSYYFIVYVNRGNVSYGGIQKEIYGFFPLLLRNIIMMTSNAPFLILVLVPLFFYRMYLVIWKRTTYNPIYDSMVIAGIFGILSYIIINKYVFHYLLPVYSFGLLGLVYFIWKLNYFRKKFFKITLVLALIIVVFSSLPTGVYVISKNKNVPIGFQKTITFLSNYINSTYKGEKIDIFFDGGNRLTQGEVYRGFDDYLQYQNVSINKYDFKSDKNNIHFMGKDSHLTVYADAKSREIKNGDLLVITPMSYTFINKKYLKSKEKDYKLLFKYEPKIDIGNYSIKSFIKYFLHLKGYSLTEDKNFFRPNDFYVYQKIN